MCIRDSVRPPTDEYFANHTYNLDIFEDALCPLAAVSLAADEPEEAAEEGSDRSPTGDGVTAESRANRAARDPAEPSEEE
eukprot:10960183-Alexandrium_andersonii.AAC.1